MKLLDGRSIIASPKSRSYFGPRVLKVVDNGPEKRSHPVGVEDHGGPNSNISQASKHAWDRSMG